MFGWLVNKSRSIESATQFDKTVSKMESKEVFPISTDADQADLELEIDLLEERIAPFFTRNRCETFVDGQSLSDVV